MFRLTKFFTLFVIIVNLKASNTNQHILEAFMRAGNWDQAKRFMQNFSGEGAEYQALSSIVKFCVGDNESLQDLSKNWSQASYALRARSTQYLVACLSSEEPDLTRLNEFRELMGNQFSETLIVREFYLKSLH